MATMSNGSVFLPGGCTWLCVTCRASRCLHRWRRRFRLKAVFLHEAGDLSRNLGEYLSRQVRLTDLRIIAILGTQEFAERDKLKAEHKRSFARSPGGSWFHSSFYTDAYLKARCMWLRWKIVTGMAKNQTCTMSLSATRPFCFSSLSSASSCSIAENNHDVSNQTIAGDDAVLPFNSSQATLTWKAKWKANSPAMYSNLPAKSASPTPTMMIDIGSDEA